MEQVLLELIIIIILCVFQSVFGVGLLLFGPPLFLMIGYDFSSTLAKILLVSVLISFLQIIYKSQLNKKLTTEYNVCILPFLIIFLISSIKTSYFDIKIFVSVLLIISSLIALMKNKIYSFKKYILSYRKYILIYIGYIHRLTNMGEAFYQYFFQL